MKSYVDLATIDAMLYMLAGMHVVHTCKVMAVDFQGACIL